MSRHQPWSTLQIKKKINTQQATWIKATEKMLGNIMEHPTSVFLCLCAVD